MKFTLREDMVLGDVTDMIRTLTYTYQCIVESMKINGESPFSDMAGALIDEQIDECCRWIDEHEEKIWKSYDEKTLRYQQALAETIILNQPKQDLEDQKEI